MMYDIAAETVSAWHLGRGWAEAKSEGIPQIDGLELG
jgi:hypothetical protein